MERIPVIFLFFFYVRVQCTPGDDDDDDVVVATLPFMGTKQENAHIMDSNESDVM